MIPGKVDELEVLVKEYKEWVTKEGLPYYSADELVVEPGITPDQREWLDTFQKRWEAVFKEDRKVGDFSVSVYELESYADTKEPRLVTERIGWLDLVREAEDAMEPVEAVEHTLNLLTQGYSMADGGHAVFKYVKLV